MALGIIAIIIYSLPIVCVIAGIIVVFTWTRREINRPKRGWPSRTWLASEDTRASKRRRFLHR
jgi:hypothetical protein